MPNVPADICRRERAVPSGAALFAGWRHRPFGAKVIEFAMNLTLDANGLVNGIDPAEDPARFSAKAIPLGEWLVVWGHATPAQIDLAEREARRKRRTLSETLQELQLVDPRVVATTWPNGLKVKVRTSGRSASHSPFST